MISMKFLLVLFMMVCELVYKGLSSSSLYIEATDGATISLSVLLAALSLHSAQSVCSVNIY